MSEIQARVSEWMGRYVDTGNKEDLISQGFSDNPFYQYRFQFMCQLKWKGSQEVDVQPRIKELLFAMAPNMGRVVKIDEVHSDLITSFRDTEIDQPTKEIHTLFLACSVEKGMILAAVVFEQYPDETFGIHIRKMKSHIEMRVMEVLVGERVPNDDVNVLFGFIMDDIPGLYRHSLFKTYSHDSLLCVRQFPDGVIRPAINEDSLWPKLLAIDSELRRQKFEVIHDLRLLTKQEREQIDHIDLEQYGQVYGVFRSGRDLLAITESRCRTLRYLKQKYGSRVLWRFMPKV